MEKCEFCSRKVLLGKKDVSNLLGARPVVLGGEETMMEMNIPINYCPRCGKKL